jgi:hypothetical protein
MHALECIKNEGVAVILAKVHGSYRECFRRRARACVYIQKPFFTSSFRGHLQIKGISAASHGRREREREREGERDKERERERERERDLRV